MDTNNFLNSLENEFSDNEAFAKFVKEREGWSKQDLLYALFHAEKDKDHFLKEMSFMDEEMDRLKGELLTQKNSASNTETGFSEN